MYQLEDSKCGPQGYLSIHMRVAHVDTLGDSKAAAAADEAAWEWMDMARTGIHMRATHAACMHLRAWPFDYALHLIRSVDVGAPFQQEADDLDVTVERCRGKARNSSLCMRGEGGNGCHSLKERKRTSEIDSHPADGLPVGWRILLKLEMEGGNR
jgi:hypothetical protein